MRTTNRRRIRNRLLTLVLSALLVLGMTLHAAAPIAVYAAEETKSEMGADDNAPEKDAVPEAEDEIPKNPEDEIDPADDDDITEEDPEEIIDTPDDDSNITPEKTSDNPDADSEKNKPGEVTEPPAADDNDDAAKETTKNPADDNNDDPQNTDNTDNTGNTEHNSAPAEAQLPLQPRNLMMAPLGASPAAPITEFEKLKAAIEAGDDVEITLDSDIAVPSDFQKIEIKEGQTVTLKGSAKLSSNTSKKLFSVQNGTLTLDGPTLNCLGVEVLDNGTFNMESGKITGNTSKSSNGIAVIVKGENAVFNLNGGSICDNDAGYNTGKSIIFVNGGGTMNMTGGDVSRNTCDGDYYFSDYQNDLKTHSIGTHGATGTIQLGTLLNPNADSSEAKTGGTFNMTGGVIQENKSGFGGALGVCSQSKATITAGTIRNNHASVGGGIIVSCPNGTASLTIGEENPKPEFNEGEYPLLAWNTSFFSGGALYVGTADATIYKAIFENNYSNGEGGAIYVGIPKDTLKMHNVLITENTALIDENSFYVESDNSFALGGGYWTCPTGDTEIAVNGGWAVFDNRAVISDALDASEDQYMAAGDDVFIASPRPDLNETYYTSLTERMLGGGSLQYFDDGGSIYDPFLGTRYFYGAPAYESIRYHEAENPREILLPVEHVNKGFALHTVTNEDSKELARKEATVIIRNNTATRGGGLGSNGNVIIGDREYPVYELTVTKQWTDNSPEEKRVPVEVTLVIDGKYDVETVTLSKDNDWTYTFTGLPKPVYDENGNPNYSIRETESGEYVLLEQTSTEDKQEYKISVRLLNRSTADQVEVTLKATKTLSGRELKDAEFSFDLLDAEGNVIETVKNDAEGNVVFSAVAFAEKDLGGETSKTFQYTIREVAGKEENITYDTKTYPVNVTVTYDSETNTLSAKLENPQGAPAFKNTYTPPETPPDNPPDNPPPKTPPKTPPSNPPSNPPRNNPPSTPPQVRGAERTPQVLGAVRVLQPAVLGEARLMTGDESYMLIWGAMLALAVSGLAAYLHTRKA